MPKHRATGNPRGRPPSLPANLGEQIINALRKRVDPKTGLVRPLWKQLARELGVSRSSIARQMIGLRQSGAIESVNVQVSPRVSWTYYRLKDDEYNQTVK